MGPMIENKTPYRQRRRTAEERHWLGLVVVGLGLAAVLAAAGYGLWYGLRHSALFIVNEVAVEGELRRLDEATVQELAGITPRTSLLGFTAAAMRERIEAEPWVERAWVEKLWPNRLRITVRERRPLALANRDGRLFYMDAKGVIFAPVQPGDTLDYPVIAGLGEEEISEVKQAALRRALTFLDLAGRGRQVLPRQNISELRVTEDGGLVLILASNPFPIHLGTTDKMDTAYYRLARVLARLYRKKEFEITAYIRMDYQPGRVLVGLRG